MSIVVGGPVLQKVCELWTLVRSRQRPVGWLSYSLKTLQRMLGGGVGLLAVYCVVCTQHCVTIIPQLLWHDLAALALALQPPECFFFVNSIYYILHQQTLGPSTTRIPSRTSANKLETPPHFIILDIIALLYFWVLTIEAPPMRFWAITVTIRSQWRNIIEIQWLQKKCIL